MKSWFSTRKEANTELKRRKARNPFCSDTVFRWTHTKRKKPFFVGTRLEGLNKWFKEDLKMKKLVYLDCCFPDYFIGSDLPTLAVCVWHGMTGRELKEAIIDEYNNMDDSFPEINIEKAAYNYVMNEDDERLFESTTVS